MKLAVDFTLVHHVRLTPGVSRIELARQLGVAPSTIGLHVDRLARAGVLLEGERKRESGSGRPRTTLQLNPDAGQFIGVDIDAQHVRAISVDFAQATIAKRSWPIRSSWSSREVLAAASTAIENVRGESPPLLGIGVAAPGVLDPHRGTSRHYRFIRGWNDLPVADAIADRFGVPVHLENNVRAMAFAERWFGQGSDVDDFLCLGIRSGIGSGIFLRGELYRGHGNRAGEIGSWPCRWSPVTDPAVAAKPASSIESATLEQVASFPAMLKHAASLLRAGATSQLRLKRDRVPGDDFLAASRSGDKVASAVLGAVTPPIAETIAEIYLLIEPQRVILAGPLAELGDLFLSPLRRAVATRLPAHHAFEPSIVASKLNAYVGALGAAGCAVQAWQPESSFPVEQV